MVPRPAGWWGYWVPRLQHADGSPAPDGPLVDALEDKLELIAAGQAVAIVSAGLRADHLRPDLTMVPLHGVEPTHVVLATRAGDRGRLVAAFRKVAADHLRPPEQAVASADDDGQGAGA